MKIKRLFSLVGAMAILFTGSSVSGAVMFAVNGGNPNDLDVIVTSPISFTVTSANSNTFFDVVFRDVYTVDQPTGFFGASTTLGLTVPGPFVSTGPGVAGIVVGGSVDANDLVLTWTFGTTRSVAINDTVTLGTGVHTINGILGSTIVPDTAAPNVFAVFNSDSNDALSDPVSVTLVPEPSSSLLLGLGALGMVLRRRR